MQNCFGIIINIIAMGLDIYKNIEEGDGSYSTLMLWLTEALRYASDLAAIELMASRMICVNRNQEIDIEEDAQQRQESRLATFTKYGIGVTSIAQFTSMGLGFFVSKDIEKGAIGVAATIAQGFAGVTSGLTYLAWRKE